MDNITKELVQKSIIRNFDDGQTIFLDWEKLTEHEINNIVLSYFDVVNIPKQSYDDTINNYHITFLTSNKSKTGYIGMFINKNRNIFSSEKYSRNDF
jgi:hypothetical protein